MKIAVLGYSGAGKSTLSKTLSEHYGCPPLFLDKIQFTENWQNRDNDEALDMVSRFMENPSWIIDGNYNRFFAERRLKEADKIILMLFPRRICLFRAFKRYFQFKGKVRYSAADGCTEKIDLEFIWWILHSGRTKSKRQYYQSIIDTYPEKTIVLKNRHATEQFISGLV